MPAKLALMNHNPKMNGFYNNSVSTNKPFFIVKNGATITSLTIKLAYDFYVAKNLANSLNKTSQCNCKQNLDVNVEYAPDACKVSR